jgi:hypothetical protein
MANYTLTYSDSVKGWVSFYSYYPDWILGMNNYLYTFRGGNLYRHNSSVSGTRNTFYADWWVRMGNPSGAFTPTRIQSVLNKAVLENKLFKTMSLQGDSPWSVQLETDLETSGYMDYSWFAKKESVYFAFIRNNSTGQLSLRSVNGIGNSQTVTSGGTVVNFSINPLVQIGSIISVGDYLYFGTTPQLAGQVTAVNVNLPIGTNQIVINTTIPGTVPIPSNINYFLYIKNSVAESHGVLGHYCTFTMENNSSDKIELFAVESEVMKSFP